MLEYWTQKSTINHSNQDLRTLSLHVLSRAGFGKSAKFQGHDEKQAAITPSSNYKEALQVILENCILILAFGPKLLAFLSQYWLPSGLRTVHEACASFQKYMTDLYEEEKRRYADSSTPYDNTLMTLLVRESQGGLTESQIYGNMFTINFAGHDTVAHTLTFALHFLSAHPEVQDWISDEIQAVMGDREASKLDYRADYHRLRRCLAVMLETIRLYVPVPTIKWTADKTQSITLGGKPVVLPPHSMVAPSYGSIQTDPKYWGPDSLEWRPSRWIKQTGSGTPGDEELDMHTRGAFIGWSEGIRDCPGKKFSQVEFVGAVAVLFRRWRVMPVTTPGESLQSARRRVMDLIKTDSGPVLLLQMLHPERAPLVWEKR